MMRTIFISSCLGVASLASVAGAQRADRPASTASGLKGNVNLEANFRLSAAAKAYAMARLEDISRIVLEAAPEIVHLKYPVYEQGAGFYASAPKANTILEYKYNLVADLGPRGLCVILEAIINQSPTGSSSGAIIENTKGRPVPGASITWSELVRPPDPSWEQVILVRDGEAPWIQLTREEFRRWQIVEEEGSSGEKRAAYNKVIEKTPYERFLAEAPERKKTRDELAVALKAFRTPAEIAAQIKEMEDAERDAAAQLKAQDAEERKKNDSLSRAKTPADLARVSLARMSATERKLPAFVIPGGSDTLFNFGTADSTYASRAVRVNIGFWDMHRSRVEVRSINMGFFAACPKSPPPPEVHEALWKIRQTIDWAALKRMVNEP